MDKNQERIRGIYDMLFAMALGNFDYRLKTSTKKDKIDKAIEVLNQVAEVITNSISELGNYAPKYIFKVGLHPLLIIENESEIKSFTTILPLQLGYKLEIFKTIPFNEIITQESSQIFTDLCQILDDNELTRRKIKLVFVGTSRQEIHYYCTLERHVPGNLVVISSISNKTEIVVQKHLQNDNSEILKIQLVYDFIMANLSNPLPTTKELSGMFGINEVKIKSEFRKTFHTSIYKLYTDERLKLALDLIKNTDDSLTAIALQSGFSNYMTFYKAFRKKYLCSPTEIVRTNAND